MWKEGGESTPSRNATRATKIVISVVDVEVPEPDDAADAAGGDEDFFRPLAALAASSSFFFAGMVRLVWYGLCWMLVSYHIPDTRQYVLYHNVDNVGNVPT